ncbi:MAG: hypothetical protein K5634_01855 [Sphaerochaetaceae bacterium]|nr:hypothetical protein [Sphaerochaetaceae bacterium]
MKKTALLSVLLFAVLSLSFAAEVCFSGETSFSGVLSVPPAGDPWKFTSATVKQTLELDVYGENTDLYVNGGAEYEALGSEVTAFLSEAYADYFTGRFAFRLGRQKASWGTSEIMSAVNVITPSDLSDPVESSPLAIDALKLSYDAFPYSFDFYFIPFFTPSTLPQSVLDMYSYYGIEITKPETKLENSEAAFKGSAYTSAGDFSLYGYWGWEDIPNMAGEYERLVMVGASAAVPVGEVTLKGEAGWYPERDEVISASAGVEWIKNDLTLTGELYGVWNREDKEITGQAGAAVNYSLLEGDLEISAGGILELKELDGAVTAGATYSFTDELKATASAVFMFEGVNGTGTYGAYKELDSLRFKAVYSF